MDNIKESGVGKLIGYLIGIALVNCIKGFFFILGGYFVLRMFGVVQ
tara:strand:+ start:28 stop:165 length:138 start_codon:yes stop_codon:yes gene_type:complete